MAVENVKMVVRLFSNRNASVVSAVRFIFISSGMRLDAEKWDLRYIGGGKDND